MKSIIRLILVAFVLVSMSQNLVSQVPYQNGEQESFNKGWMFAKGDQAAKSIDFDDSEWRSLDLPHDWAIEGPFDVKYNARAGGLPFHGEGWYRKHFTVPAEKSDKRIRIHFDGAMSLAKVWLNGEFIGERPYGYTGFGFDISDLVKRNAENVIVVQLTPEDLSSRWYPGAGLYRNSWIEYNNPVHFSYWGTYVTTPEITAEYALVENELTIENHTEKDQDIVLNMSILDADGKEVAKAKKNWTIKAGDTEIITERAKVSEPQLWGIDSPYLYKMVSKVMVDGELSDTYITPLGIRTIEYSADEGFKLNGEYMKFNGVCLHHDHGPLGGAVSRRAAERQLEIMKAMGVNSIRTSHNPPSPELLEFCDRLGILVQDEAFDCWQMPKVPNGYNKYFDDWYEADLRDMIRRDRNHPSIVMWSIGNEILEQGNKDKGWIWAKLLSEICHEEDPTRPTTAGFNNYPGAEINKLAQQIDIVGLNYKPTKYKELQEKYPDMIIYGSETSSCVSSRGVYHLPIEKYKTHESLQVTSYDLIGPPWAYPPDIEFMIQDKYPQFLGEFIWTGFDYLGEPTPYGGKDNSTNGYWNADWPARSSYFGAADLCGFPKDRYFLYQSQWTDEPMIHLLPHWNWSGMEGKEIPVMSYTNCEEVELFLNGKSLGKKTKGVDKPFHIVDFKVWDGSDYYTPYRLRWDVPYVEGELKAVGYIDGKAVEEMVINTAGKAAKIELSPDREVINANGYDLSYITVEVLDKNGNICPLADNLVEFEVEGAAEFRAVGNGNAATTASFQVPNRKAFSGKCLLIIQSLEGQGGKIKVTASSRGLKKAQIELLSE